MVASLRLLVVASLALVAFAGCTGSPESDDAFAADLAAALVDDRTPPEAALPTADEPAEETTPEPTPATPSPPSVQDRDDDDSDAAPVAPAYVEPSLAEILAAQAAAHRAFLESAREELGLIEVPFFAPHVTTEVVEELPPAPVATGTLLDESKTWAFSAGGAGEYTLGCAEDGLDCAYFRLPAGSEGQTFTMTFGALVPAAAYFIDLYSGADYVATFGDPTGAFGAFSSDPIPGYTDSGHAVYTNVVPVGITEMRAYAAGGADFFAHLVIGATSCESDAQAFGSPTAGVYATPMDNADAPGSLWIYTEGNDSPGLQRNDDTRPTACAGHDTIVF